MKALKFFLTFTAVVALFFLANTGTVTAFHSGGVAECSGCHSMHAPKAGGLYLLVGIDPSSTCLSCHMQATDTAPNSYHVSTVDASLGAGLAPLQRTPGGDFGWLKKTYTFGTTTELGQTHGHNIIAGDYSYTVDSENATAPGGTFPSAQLACTSCHDPHGSFRRNVSGVIARTGQPIYASGSYNGTTVAANEPTATESVGVYRLLAGAGYTKDGITFTGVPAAKVPATYNRTEATTQTRTSYGNITGNGHVTWGNWCGTCHPDMHSNGHYVHPVDNNLGSDVILNYQQYVKTGDMTGSAGTSFLSLVPFVSSGLTYPQLASLAVNNNSQLGGPASGDQVTCVSCHRAHASGMMYGLRYDVEYEFMVKAGDYVGTDNPDYPNWGSRAPQQARGRTVAEWRAAYYDRPATMWARYQRVLCNKCHQKD